MGSISERVAHRAAAIRRADEMTPAEWESYRKKHPDADPSKHKIVKPEDGKAKQDPGKSKPPPLPQQGKGAPQQAPKPPELGKPQGKKTPPPLPGKKQPAKQQKPAKPDAKKDKHDSHGDKPDRSEGWRQALKGLKESAVKFVENAPKAVKHFLGDPDFRRSALKEAKEAAVKLPAAMRTSLIKTVKEEVHEFKEAGAGIRSVMSGKKMSHHQKKAFKAVTTHLAIGAAAAAFAATGPLAGAGVFAKNLAKHVALKSVKKALGSLHTMEEVGHIGHGVHHYLDHVASEFSSEPLTAETSSDIPDGNDPEQAMTDLILAAVAKSIEQLSDEDFTHVLNNISEDDPEQADKTAAARVFVRFRDLA